MDDYVSVAISRNGLLQNTLAHYKDYYTAILLDFKRWWLLVIALLLLLFVVTAALRSRRGAAGSALGAVLTLAVMTLLIFGVYPLLRAPLYAPRSMYGFGAYLAILAVAAVDGKLHWPPRLTCLALSWAFFVFAFTYGNALSVQDEYTKFRMSAVITDLNDLEAFSSDQEKVLQLSGSIGLAPQLRNMPQDYRMLNDLVQVTFREGWQWGEYGFYNLYDIRNVHADSDLDLRQASLPVLKDGMYHTILGDGEHFLIVLK